METNIFKDSLIKQVLDYKYKLKDDIITKLNNSNEFSDLGLKIENLYRFHDDLETIKYHLNNPMVFFKETYLAEHLSSHEFYNLLVYNPHIKLYDTHFSRGVGLNLKDKTINNYSFYQNVDNRTIRSHVLGEVVDIESFKELYLNMYLSTINDVEGLYNSLDDFKLNKVYEKYKQLVSLRYVDLIFNLDKNIILDNINLNYKEGVYKNLFEYYNKHNQNNFKIRLTSIEDNILDMAIGTSTKSPTKFDIFIIATIKDDGVNFRIYDDIYSMQSGEFNMDDLILGNYNLELITPSEIINDLLESVKEMMIDFLEVYDIIGS